MKKLQLQNLFISSNPKAHSFIQIFGGLEPRFWTKSSLQPLEIKLNFKYPSGPHVSLLLHLCHPRCNALSLLPVPLLLPLLHAAAAGR
jgi:hypothetical protein